MGPKKTVSDKLNKKNTRLTNLSNPKNEQGTGKNDRKFGPILGVQIFSTQNNELLTQIPKYLSLKKKFLIVTPNPEIVLMASRDRVLAKILSGADFSLIDGVGLVMADRFLKLRTPSLKLFRGVVSLLQGIWVGKSLIVSRRWLFRYLKPIKGREATMDILKLANDHHLKVFILGPSREVLLKVTKKVQANFPNVNLLASTGPMLDKNAKPVSLIDIKIQNDTVIQINKFKPDILFVTFGPPKQEKWLDKWMPLLSVGGAMTVGSSFDTYSGVVRLSPKFVSHLGFEWLWRLLMEPRLRIKRVINSVVVFSYRVFVSKIYS